jgi:gamma-glutamyl phosphate reductase
MWTQAKVYLAAGILIAWSALALFLGREWGRADGASREAAQLSKQMDAVLAGQAEAASRAERRQKMLDRLVKSEGKVREIIRDNPSGCRLTDPVHDGLREAIRQGNAPRKVPGPA